MARSRTCGNRNAFSLGQSAVNHVGARGTERALDRLDALALASGGCGGEKIGGTAASLVGQRRGLRAILQQTIIRWQHLLGRKSLPLCLTVVQDLVAGFDNPGFEVAGSFCKCAFASNVRSESDNSLGLVVCVVWASSLCGRLGQAYDARANVRIPRPGGSLDRSATNRVRADSKRRGKSSRRDK